NEEHGIVPTTIVKEIAGLIEISKEVSDGKKGRRLSKGEREQMITQLTREMRQAAKMLEFEHAAFLRDRIEKLRRGETLVNETDTSRGVRRSRRGRQRDHEQQDKTERPGFGAG
ncbi:MAG: UvrB/UvrC motif-containing protein, partial [Oscillospiraceae bacterium]